MKKFFFFLCFIILLFQNYSKMWGYYEHFVISPGLKFGYLFGKNSNWFLGFEFTFGHLSEEMSEGKQDLMFYGTVVNLDFVSKYVRFSVAGEYQSWPIPGVNLGPSILFSDNSVNFGFIVGSYFSLAVINFSYNFSYFFRSCFSSDSTSKSININEIGFQLKVPLLYPKYEFMR
jgi:hypothetical protein